MDAGLSVFVESECTAEQVLADGPVGCGLVIFVYEDVSPCFVAYASDTYDNATLGSAHVELRIRQEPNRRRFPKAKLRALAERAATGVIVKPLPKSEM